MPESIYEYKQSDNGYLIELRIIKVKKDENFPEGIKYSLVAIEKKTGKRILGFDNERGQGHHMHRLGRELPYAFKNEWTLIGDFYIEYEKIKRRLLKR